MTSVITSCCILVHPLALCYCCKELKFMASTCYSSWIGILYCIHVKLSSCISAVMLYYTINVLDYTLVM